jgi:hypothetical protein
MFILQVENLKRMHYILEEIASAQAVKKRIKRNAYSCR